MPSRITDFLNAKFLQLQMPGHQPRPSQQPYRRFNPTKAVSFLPPHQQFLPQQGYSQRMCPCGCATPVLIISASHEILFELFLNLVELAAPTGASMAVDDSFGMEHGKYRTLSGDWFDTSVIKSHLLDFEDFLVDDGHTGIAATHKEQTVFLDEHKLIYLYNCDGIKQDVQTVFQKYEIRFDESLVFLNEVAHQHHTIDPSRERLRDLLVRLHADEDWH